MQGNLHLGISRLPDAATSIAGAKLVVNLTEIVEFPTGDLIDLKALHVDYGDTLQGTDYRSDYLPGMTAIPANEATGTQTVDVTTALRYPWARSNTVQFSLYFKNRNVATSRSV